MFTKIDEGNIVYHPGKGRVFGGPRVAVLPDGTLACSHIVSSFAGSNDMTPVLSFSNNIKDWSEGKPIWPELSGKKSIFVSIRSAEDGTLTLGGMAFDIAAPGETFWSDEAGGMKENRLVFSCSDDGREFSPPEEIELPYYASAEQPGGVLADADGTMTMIYAPYPTIEKKEPVDTNRIVMMRSADGGKTFSPGTFGAFEGKGTYAESWLVRLTDGRLMAGSWLISDAQNADVYFLSDDNGKTFDGPHPMDFKGQTTSLTPYDSNGVLIPYNQRKSGTVGVWLALAKPDAKGFNLLANEPVWKAAAPTRSNTSGDFSDWTDYSFGEPHAAVLPDGTFLVTFWYQQKDGAGIRYVHLRKEGDV